MTSAAPRPFEGPFLEQGAGSPVVLVHGSNADHRIWAPHARLIGPDVHFLAPTQRYFGTLPWPDDGKHFSIPTHAEDLADFVRAQRLEPVSLVGWSYGAAVCLMMAVQHVRVGSATHSLRAGDRELRARACGRGGCDSRPPRDDGPRARSIRRRGRLGCGPGLHGLRQRPSRLLRRPAPRGPTDHARQRSDPPVAVRGVPTRPELRRPKTARRHARGRRVGEPRAPSTTSPPNGRLRAFPRPHSSSFRMPGTSCPSRTRRFTA